MNPDRIGNLFHSLLTIFNREKPEGSGAPNSCEIESKRGLQRRIDLILQLPAPENHL